MKTSIIALSLVLSSLAAVTAHAGTVIAVQCPKSGAVILDTGNGENELTITQGGKHYTVTERTERMVVKGKIMTVQGASMADNANDFRAMGIPADWERTGIVTFIRSDRDGFEWCNTTDAQSY
ncbi:hypothetical protein ZL58_13995 [Salmonella enterica subsp. enterica serovar Typhimurium]|nr:hypothetical protein [Salmonella enterica subsp. enterica serovar Typhimurium]